ncbi:MAG: FAD-dependent oxidoreductase [Kiritimatiellae bacterium]|nr:FAD-dependent oxidoreductase [Kiritimatiellia bacterium]
MNYPTTRLDTGFCVVGGGLAGLCAALAAARHGARTVLVQDRPMLGGNASSEIRMHVCGAHGSNRRETGILEEIQLENLRYNAGSCWSVFDSLLWGLANREPNLRVVLDASVCACECAADRSIRSVRAWQGTTQRWIEVSARLFADCSGDAVLAPLSGADFRVGREARSEYGENEAPAEADSCTMGNSILFQTAEFATPQDFVAPPWALDFTAPERRPWIENRDLDPTRNNYWWIETGGADDTIGNAELHRDELLRIAYGVWDYVKNHSRLRKKLRNFGLEWVGSLPGKRESRRYLGDHVLVQGEVQGGGAFPDVVAYGGWYIDNHYPKGFWHEGPGTKYTECPSPFGIPYRCLYSRNVPNLFCAGRDISCSHVAMSATRVMATCALEGQAVGTAAAIAARDRADPRDLSKGPLLAELQRTLLEDDCLLPGLRREVRGPCAAARLSATGGEGVARLRDGMDRDWDDGEHGWRAPLGAAAEYRFAEEVELREARLVFDSFLDRRENDRPLGGNDECSQGRYYRALADRPRAVPATLVRSFRIDRLDADGAWRPEAEVADNHRRLVRVPLNCRPRGLRLVPLATWGAPDAHVFAFDAR